MRAVTAQSRKFDPKRKKTHTTTTLWLGAEQRSFNRFKPFGCFLSCYSLSSENSSLTSAFDSAASSVRTCQKNAGRARNLCFHNLNPNASQDKINTSKICMWSLQSPPHLVKAAPRTGTSCLRLHVSVRRFMIGRLCGINKIYIACCIAVWYRSFWRLYRRGFLFLRTRRWDFGASFSAQRVIIYSRQTTDAKDWLGSNHFTKIIRPSLNVAFLQCRLELGRCTVFESVEFGKSN